MFKIGDKVKLIRHIKSRYTESECNMVSYGIIESFENQLLSGIVNVQFYTWDNIKIANRNRVSIIEDKHNIVEIELYDSYNIEDIKENLNKLGDKLIKHGTV